MRQKVIEKLKTFGRWSIKTNDGRKLLLALAIILFALSARSVTKEERAESYKKMFDGYAYLTEEKQEKK